MSKPARPSLSNLLPAKGAATQPEPQPVQPTGENEAQAVAQPTMPLGRKPDRTPRVATTLKISEPVYRRLREASFREEVDKQDLVDQALDALLTQMGY
jgi:hypothetical protein